MDFYFFDTLNYFHYLLVAKSASPALLFRTTHNIFPYFLPLYFKTGCLILQPLTLVSLPALRFLYGKNLRS